MSETIDYTPQRKKEYFVTVRPFNRSALTTTEQLDNITLQNQTYTQRTRNEILQITMYNKASFKSFNDLPLSDQ